jgi:hypothetical protein
MLGPLPCTVYSKQLSLKICIPFLKRNEQLCVHILKIKEPIGVDVEGNFTLYTQIAITSVVDPDPDPI